MTPRPLEARAVTVRYGGLRALDDVWLEVDDGAIAGVIGPNGAGKTTLFDCVTGLIEPHHGEVRLFGHDFTRWPMHRRSRLGVGRTFQRLELFGSLSVIENLVVALESRSSGGGLASELVRGRVSVERRGSAEAKAAGVLDRLGLAEHAQARAGDLPMGLSRMVELARCLCTDPRLVLLDEPSSGLNAEETERLATTLRSIRDEGRTLVIVEHDMDLVMGLCEVVHVLDFGKVLAHGSPDVVRNDARVRSAYLGQEVSDDAAG